MKDHKDFIIRDGLLVEYVGTETNVVIPEGVHTVCDGVFKDRTDIISAELPETVTHIGVGAFLRCRALCRILLPDSLTEIGMGAFAYCSSLERVNIPKNVKKLGCSAFCGCHGLETVDLNAERCRDITSDGNYNYYTYTDHGNFYDDITPVFYSCPALKTVNVGAAVRYIPKELFREVRQLESVNVYCADRLRIGFGAFDPCLDVNALIHNESGAQIIYESLKNHVFPEVNVEEGTEVEHFCFGKGRIVAVMKEKGLVKVETYLNETHCFLYPDSILKGELKI